MSGLPAAASRTAAGDGRQRRRRRAAGRQPGRLGRRIPIARPSCHDGLMTDAQSPTQAFRNARDLLLRHREDYPAALAEFTWPQLDEFNWALDWFDVIAAEHPDRDALRIVADGDAAARISYARDGRPLQPGGQLAARPRRPAGRPAAADAGQHRAAVGDHPGRDEARRGDHPGQHPARPGGPGRPGGPRRRPARDHRVRPHAAVRGRRRETGPGSRSAPARGAPARTAGTVTPRRPRPAPASSPDGPTLASRSVAAVFHVRDHRPAQAGGAYPRLATRPAICPPCTGSGCSPATCT